MKSSKSNSKIPVVTKIFFEASVARLDDSPLKPMPNVHYFTTLCQDNTYDISIFGKLADNGLRGCRPVVAFD